MAIYRFRPLFPSWPPGPLQAGRADEVPVFRYVADLMARLEAVNRFWATLRAKKEEWS